MDEEEKKLYPKRIVKWSFNQRWQMSGVFSGKATNRYQNHLKAVTNELVDNRSMPPLSSPE